MSIYKWQLSLEYYDAKLLYLGWVLQGWKYWLWLWLAYSRSSLWAGWQ